MKIIVPICTIHSKQKKIVRTHAGRELTNVCVTKTQELLLQKNCMNNKLTKLEFPLYIRDSNFSSVNNI